MKNIVSTALQVVAEGTRRKQKTWCRHILWDEALEFIGRKFIFRLGSRGNGKNGIWYEVPRSWKVCPICLAERPTKANIEAGREAARYD